MRFLYVLFLASAFLPCAAAIAEDHPDKPGAGPGERDFLILKDLPLDAAQYQPEAARLVAQGIPDKYGHEEWAAVVLTNEIHHHLGVYTIIGAKMGVRAREILGAPFRSVNVTVETGGIPPVSCVIDGLQVALGSTLAQNLIHAPAVDTPKTAATFAYKDRRLRLSLKPEILRRVQEMIADAIKECGNLTPAYFEKIESRSYEIWAEFDRHAIFTEEDRSAPTSFVPVK